MTKKNQYNMLNAKAHIMYTFEDEQIWEMEDIMELQRVRYMETQSDWCNLMERE